jgi:HSP20 family molecular chaperone IbpA
MGAAQTKTDSSKKTNEGKKSSEPKGEKTSSSNTHAALKVLQFLTSKEVESLIASANKLSKSAVSAIDGLSEKVENMSPNQTVNKLRDKLLKKNGNFSPDFNIEETKKAFIISLEVPSFDMDDIEVDTFGTHIVIKGHREISEDKIFLHNGIKSKSFEFKHQYQCAIDEPAIGAVVKNGVLQVTVPKDKKINGIKININPG